MPMTPLPKGTTPDEEVVCCAIHSVTEREHVDVGTERGHCAADVGAEGQRQRLAEAALAFADQPVPRPHARRLHSDQHLARPRRRTGNLVEPHGVDAAGFMNSNGSHHSPLAVSKFDARLIKLLLKARRFNATLVGSDEVSFAALAEREGVSPSYFTPLVRLSYLARRIFTHAILDGRQPRDLTAEKLLEHSTSAARLARSADRARFCLNPIRTQKPPLSLGCPRHRRCGTGIWPDRDITARRPDVAASCASLPTTPLTPARTPAENRDFST